MESNCFMAERRDLPSSSQKTLILDLNLRLLTPNTNLLENNI